MMNCCLLVLTETRSALPPPSPFSLSLSSFLLDCSLVHPSIPLFFFYASFSLPSVFLFHFSDSLSASLAFCSSSLFLPLFSSCALFLSLYCPRDFYICPPLFLSVLFNSLLCLWFTLTLSLSSIFPPLVAFCICICLAERKGSPQKQPGLISVFLSVILLRSYEMSKFIRTLEGDIFSPCLLHTSTATMTVTY